MGPKKVYSKLLIPIAAATAVSILGTSPALAQEGSKLHFVPALAVQVVYDDNIYSGNGQPTVLEAEEDDFIFHAMPGLHLMYELPLRGSMEIGVDGDFAKYADNDKNDWQTFKAMFAFDYQKPNKGPIFGISDQYTHAEDPYGSATNYGIGALKERWMNQFKAKAGFDLGNGFRVLGYFNHDQQDYEQAADNSQDYTQHEVGAGVERKLMPKTWGFVRYHHGSRDYDSVSQATNTDLNSDWNRVNMGLTWDVAAKLQGELNFGYKWINYDHYSDQSALIAATTLNYAQTENTSLSLNIMREQREAGGNILVTGTNQPEAFADTNVGLAVNHRFYTRYIFNAGVSYGISEYESPSTREDKNYMATAGLDYEIRTWLTASLNYTLSKKNSNDNANDFTKNQTMVMLKAVY